MLSKFQLFATQYTVAHQAPLSMALSKQEYLKWVAISTPCKMPGWMKHMLESRLPGEISIASDMQMTPPLCQKVKKLKSLLMKVKEESEAGLKLNI